MLPHAIYNIIADYARENKLLYWVDENKINWQWQLTWLKRTWLKRTGGDYQKK